MINYIIKRVLLMIPTFALISLIIFMVLNLAPGRPGQTQVGSDGMQSSESMEARESYRIFKEQFNFDKPILFNTRFMLTRADVEAQLQALADYRRPTCPEAGERPDNCLEADQKPSSGAVIEAQELLEDWGEHVIPQLISIAQDHQRWDMRRLAAAQLPGNAQQRLINEYGGRQTPEQEAYNREAQALNDEVRGWRLAPGDGEAELDALLKARWIPWYEAHKARFEHGAGDKVVMFFTDTRFAKYWANLATLNFGVSHIDKKPVLETIKSKSWYTFWMSLLSIIFAYIISVPMGIWSAYNQKTRADGAVTVGLFMLYSLPSFFIAVVLLQLLTIGTPLQIFPTGGFIGRGADQMTTLEQMKSVAWHLVLPVFCMTYRSLASLSRYARTGVLDVIRADYIRTARAKGLSEGMVVVKHAVRNGMIPILTLLGSLLPALIGGSVIIEVIFNIQGLGLYLFESIGSRDYNAIMAVLLVSTVLTLVGLLVTDLSYALVDPRISFD